MDTLTCIEKRASVRSYLDRPVPRELIEKIVRAGLQAPTAMNSRDIAITVVASERLTEVASAMREAMGEEAASNFMTDGKFDFHRGGKALIVVSFGRKSVLPEQNTGCVMENMYLAATELGLGACWINQFYSFRSDKINRLLGLEEGYLPYAALSVGFTDVEPKKRARDGEVKYYL